MHISKHRYNHAHFQTFIKLGLVPNIDKLLLSLIYSTTNIDIIDNSAKFQN